MDTSGSRGRKLALRGQIILNDSKIEGINVFVFNYQLIIHNVTEFWIIISYKSDQNTSGFFLRVCASFRLKCRRKSETPRWTLSDGRSERLDDTWKRNNSLPRFERCYRINVSTENSSSKWWQINPLVRHCIQESGTTKKGCVNRQCLFYECLLGNAVTWIHTWSNCF